MPADLTRIDLPLAPHLREISALLDRCRSLVLHAEPGAGKSTLVPPYLLEAAWLGGGRIVMLEPRRVAAAAVASRIAELLDERVGERAGYRVRSESRVSSRTRIEVVTEALLTRMIQADPLLEGVSLLVFDEFHERSIHADLALALSLEVKRARPELALLIMSATLERERIAAFLAAATGAEAPVLSVPGRSHPVTTRYRAPPERGPWEEAFAAAVTELAAETDAGGTLLAFLPGMREIHRVAERLEETLPAGVELQTLHGSMPLEEQRRVIAAPTAREQQRVILATSVAETSLTVPGVRVVADAGFARLARFHPASGMDRLVTERVSRSSAEQRRGRAGRLGPGLCLRFWRESEPLTASPVPEILRSDLAGTVLECAAWGAREPGGLAWLDPPPEAAWAQAVELLRGLGFLDERGGATAEGRDAAALGLHPRLAALARAATGGGHAAPGLAAAMVSLIEERDGSGLEGEVDFRLRLAAFRQGGGSRAWRAAVARESERIVRLLGTRAGPWSEDEEERAGCTLVAAFPDRVARKESDGLWRFPSGRVARLAPGAGLVPLSQAGEARSRAAAREDWLVAVEVDAGESIGTIRWAAPVSAPTAARALAPITRESLEVEWRLLTPKGVRRRMAGKLVLSERPAPPSAESIRSSFFERLRAEGLPFLPWDDGSMRLRERLRFFAARGGELSVSGDGPFEHMLTESAAGWLDGWLDLSGGPVLTARRLREALAALPRKRGALEHAAPEAIVLPTGGRRRIDYSGSEPAVEARIQEVFGLESTPLLGGAPLTFRLLSPASRPLQITSDLPSFWKNTYPEVRKEMRGRYPRHYWPEDPLQAEPTTRARPRKQ